MAALNDSVTDLVNQFNHPKVELINAIRQWVLSTSPDLSESVKWNSPTFSIGQEDRITLRIQPPPVVQLIFHRGSKKRPQPPQKLIQDPSNLLTWKEHDRALINLTSTVHLDTIQSELSKLLVNWIEVSRDK